jgi:CheY-like chemotaxis protein
MSKRILVVDDNHYVADASARLISLCGYETKTAYDGREAVEQFAAFAPDMVLMDIGMPELDGYEAATRMRQEAASADVLLVAVTCWSEEQDKQRALASGFNLHVAKPVSLGTLYDLLGLLHRDRRGQPNEVATCGS